MKDNVDLTINRMFSRPSRRGLSFTVKNYLRKLNLEPKFPWSDIELYSNYSPNDTPILLGDKEMRRKQREFLDSFNGTICHCCGVSITAFPWEDNDNLCKKCRPLVNNYDRTTVNNNRCPWRDYDIRVTTIHTN